VAENVDGWLYLKNQDVTLKGLQFEGFGQVLVGAVALSDGAPHHSTTGYGFQRFQPPSADGSGLPLQMPASPATVGPHVVISDSVFINVENAFTFVSDTTQAGRVDFHNNVLTGSFGMVDINSLHWTEVYAAGNEWSDATGERAQPHVKQSGLQTGFRIGTDDYVDLDGHYTKLQIVNNYAHDIQSVGTYTDTNAAVFVDVRGAEALNPADNNVSFNKIVRVQGLKGQEDSNAIYAKAWGLTVQGNYIEASGAKYLDAVRNGSEATGVLVKPLQDGVAKDIQVIGNTFVDMPTTVDGVVPDLSVVKISEAIGNTSVSFNTFIRGGNVSGETADGVVRIFGDYESVKVVGNAFNDVTFGAGDNAIVFHELKDHGVGRVEVSNNAANKSVGDFRADTQLVYFDATPTTLVTGHNTLDGGYDMLLSLKGSQTATVQTYSPPLVPTTTSGAPGVLGLSVTVRGPLAENTRTETRVADLALSGADGAAIAVSDQRFMVSGDGLYLKAGQNVNYEAQSSVNVSITLTKDGESLTKALVLPISDMDDAPTAVKVGALASIPENTSERTALGVVTVSDPDTVSAFRTNTVTVSDSRFEVASGQLVLKAGQVVDYETASTIPLTLTARGATGSASMKVNLPVVDVADDGTPSPATGVWRESAAYTRAIEGTTGADSLLGTSAAELLEGGNGADVMTGAGGDDTYAISVYKDVIVEAEAAGVDTALVASLRYVLPDNVENLSADNPEGVLLVANSGANMVTGGSGADTLVGAAGDDLMAGRAGADLFLIAPGEGADVIRDFTANDRLSISGAQFISFAQLKAQFQQVGADAVLGFTGGGKLVLKDVQVTELTSAQFSLDGLRTQVADSAPHVAVYGGTSMGDLLVGSDGADYLDGKTGADVMAGGAGDDSYLVDDPADRVVENAGEGVDQVLLRGDSYALDLHVENLIVGGTRSADVQGNAGANRIVGGEGADTIAGGGGADVLTGGDSADVFVYAWYADRGDTITDFERGVDSLDMSALVDRTGGSLSTAAVSGGLGVYLNDDGAATLVVTLRGVPALFNGDLVV
jgi:Ca2+-binding RTX toxin-like protein